jgi:hypothetical protein
MALTDRLVLRQILDSQIELATKMDTMNTRLFGGEGQKGCIPILFEKHDHLSGVVQIFKDEALKAVQSVKDVEIGNIKVDVNDLKTNAKIAMWKASAISSVAGGGLGIGVTALVKKLLGMH